MEQFFFVIYKHLRHCDLFSTKCVTLRGLPQAVFSNRRSLPYSVAGRSSYLTAGSYTMYRRAHNLLQTRRMIAISVCLGLFRRWKTRALRSARIMQ